MANAIFVVKSSPSDINREAEYNDWYDNTHLPQVRALPGFVGARRYRQNPARPGLSDLPVYLVVYDIDADDPQGAVSELHRRAAEGLLDTTDAIASTPAPEGALYYLRDADPR